MEKYAAINWYNRGDKFGETTETVKTKDLLESKILSSLQPRIGKQFTIPKLEIRKKKLIKELRKKLIYIAIEEKESELEEVNKQFDQMKQNYIQKNQNANQFMSKLDSQMIKITHELNKRMNKKVSFHKKQKTEINFVKKNNQSKNRRTWTVIRKRKNRINYRNKVKRKKKEK